MTLDNGREICFGLYRIDHNLATDTDLFRLVKKAYAVAKALDETTSVFYNIRAESFEGHKVELVIDTRESFDSMAQYAVAVAWEFAAHYA